MKNTFLLAVHVLIIGLVVSLQAHSALSFALDLREGGRLSSKAKSQFESYMASQACELAIVDEPIPAALDNLDIYFSVDEAELSFINLQPALIAKTVDNKPLTIAILIKSSTNIDALNSIQGERLAIISHQSFLGGKQAKQLLTNAGVALDDRNIYPTGNYFGALSLLLHGDVFIAAIPGPLARQWKDHNKLSIIAESSPFQLGRLLINKSIDSNQLESCTQAFLSLNKINRRDKKMDIFPAWIAGFKH